MAETVARIKREQFAHYLNVTPQGITPTYERLGLDNDTITRTKNMTVDKNRNVIGDNNIIITKGDEEVSITPYVARKGTKLFELLMSLDDDDAELDELATDYVEVKMWKENDVILNTATKRACFIEITEVGGDLTGFQIPFNLHLGGIKQKGTWENGTFTSANNNADILNTFKTDTVEDDTVKNDSLDDDTFGGATSYMKKLSKK